MSSPRQSQKIQDKSLSPVDFSNGNVPKIVRNLEPNEAHGHDVISIRMIIICDGSICKSLKPILQFS